MVNKKLIVGMLAVLVVLMSVQGFGTVMADNNARALNSFTVLVVGQGMVCWSSDSSNGCTQNSSTVTVQDGRALTLTAKEVNGSRFAFWESNGATMASWDSLFKCNSSVSVTVNPYSAFIVDGLTISAIFN